MVTAGACSTTVAAAVCAAAALGGGSPGYALLGALLGGGLLGVGVLMLHPVASVMPRLTLPIALMTYLLQLLVALAVLLALERADAGSVVDHRWLFGAQVATVLGWLFAHAYGVSREARTDVGEAEDGC